MSFPQRLFALIFLAIGLILPAFGQSDDAPEKYLDGYRTDIFRPKSVMDSVAQKDTSKKDDKKWDVSKPHGPVTNVEFDTD